MKKVFAIVVALVLSLSMMVTVLAVDTASAAFVPSVGAEDAAGSSSSSDDTNGTVTFYGTNVINGGSGAGSTDAGETAPNTGDETNIVLWGSVFALSAGAAAILAVNRRKAKSSK